MINRMAELSVSIPSTQREQTKKKPEINFYWIVQKIGRFFGSIRGCWGSSAGSVAMVPRAPECVEQWKEAWRGNAADVGRF